MLLKGAGTGKRKAEISSSAENHTGSIPQASTGASYVRPRQVPIGDWELLCGVGPGSRAGVMVRGRQLPFTPCPLCAHGEGLSWAVGRGWRRCRVSTVERESVRGAEVVKGSTQGDMAEHCRRLLQTLGGAESKWGQKGWKSLLLHLFF